MAVGSPAIVEKDFWVCWTLGQIFTAESLTGPLFKGGTSLSKVYGIIERFSEDVDIVLDRHALGFEGESDPINIAGTNRRKRRLEELAAACSQIVQVSVRETLEARFKSELGDAGWAITPDVADRDGQSLLFEYPVGLEPRLYGTVGYIRPIVRLEFGCRGDVWPTELCKIRPSVAEQFPDLFGWAECPVRVLRPERTFGRKSRCSTPSRILARCRPDHPVTITMSLECTGTTSATKPWPILLCWKRSLSTRASSFEKPRRGTTWLHRGR